MHLLFKYSTIRHNHDLVDVIFQTEYNTWDFLMKGEHKDLWHLRRTFQLFLTSKGITSKRIGLKSNGHQRVFGKVHQKILQEEENHTTVMRSAE